MKPNNRKKAKKLKIKKGPIVKTKKEHILVIAQEFKFARLLSGNEKKTRDRVLKALKKWLLNCFEKGYEFKEDDFSRVWKGLFYAVWMSDKPLIQEELCENIAEILDLFPAEQIKNAVLMTKAGFKMLATGWYGIDHHRMDKFLMLVRRYLRGSLRYLLRCNWSLESCNLYTKMLSGPDGILALKTPPYARNALSMILHFIDCFLEELAKVSEGKIPDESMVSLLRPFCALVCGGEDLALCVAARRLLTGLLRQSELGLQYADAEQAWQRMGCPVGGPDALELEIEEDDDGGEQNDAVIDDNSETSRYTRLIEIITKCADKDLALCLRVTVLDPRAGRVDVVLPLLPVPAALLADDMRRLMETSSCASKAYKRAKICLQRFEELSNNVYPLRLKDTDFLAELEEPMPKPEEAAERLTELERRLVVSSDELALRGLGRRHRKRLLAKSRAGLSIVDDVAIPVEVPVESTNGDWKIEEATLDDEQKTPNDISNNKKKLTKKEWAKKKRKLEEGPSKVLNIKKVKHESNQRVQKPATEQANSKQKIAETNKGNLKKVKNKKTEEKKEKGKDDNKKPVTAPVKKDALLSNDKNKVTVKSAKENSTKQRENRDTFLVRPIKATVVSNKIKNHKRVLPRTITSPKLSLHTPKKVKFALKNNGAQGPVDYYKSVRQSPNIPFDSSKQPSKTNLKPSTPSPINPFFKKKLKLQNKNLTK